MKLRWSPCPRDRSLMRSAILWFQEFSMCFLLWWIYALPPCTGLSSWEGVLRRLLVFVLNHIRWQWICIFNLTLHSFLKWNEKLLRCVWDCDPMDYTVHETLQARILLWVAFPFSTGSSQPRDQAQVSHIAGGFFTSWATREALPRTQFHHLFVFFLFKFPSRYLILGLAASTHHYILSVPVPTPTPWWNFVGCVVCKICKHRPRLW